MLQRLGRSVSVILLGLAAPVWAQSPPPAPVRTARTVVYHPRELVALRARVHYTTLIVLPEGEAVVEATCGDKEVWIVNVRDGLVSVKPTKAGASTNLNLVATPGQVYAFLGVLVGIVTDNDLLKNLRGRPGLGFVPLMTERFDLLMRQRDSYRPPLQTLMASVAATDAANARSNAVMKRPFEEIQVLSRHSSTMASGANASGVTVSLPASIFAESRISSMSRSRCCPDSSICCRCSRCSGVKRSGPSSSSSCAKPRMAPSGVRSS